MRFRKSYGRCGNFSKTDDAKRVADIRFDNQKNKKYRIFYRKTPFTRAKIEHNMFGRKEGVLQ